MIQKEPIDSLGPETRGLVDSIGIVKGKPFASSDSALNGSLGGKYENVSISIVSVYGKWTF